MSPKAVYVLNGKETASYADLPNYQAADKRRDAKAQFQRQAAMHPDKRNKLGKASSPIHAFMEKIENCKVSIRAKAAPSFRAVKRQLGYIQVRYRV